MLGCASQDDVAPTLSTTSETAPATVPAGTPGKWRALTNPAPFQPGAPMLLNDGSVVVQEYGTENWHKLTPDSSGDYGKGTWSDIASMPTGYSPLFYSSAILPDGRMIIEGGEYLALQAVWTTRGAIYNPAKDSWTSVNPPSGWTMIGDASGMVLPDGRYLLSDCCDQGAPLAILNPDNLTWQAFGNLNKQTATNDEESWALLPDDTIVTIDSLNTQKPTESERLDINAMKWASAGSTVVQIQDPDPSSQEQGPFMLAYDGHAYAIGATSHCAVYDVTTKAWAAGPSLPMMGTHQLGSEDGPGVVMPDGTMMIALSPGPPTDAKFTAGVHFFLFNGTTYTETDNVASSPANRSYQDNFLVLPSGEILMTDQSVVSIYTPAGPAMAAAGPVVTAAPVEITTADPDPTLPENAATPGLLPVTTIHPGQSYKFGGEQLSGLTQGAYYGDDAQAYSNLPIVRLTSMETGHLRYASTHHASNYSLAPHTKATARFDVPDDIEPGVATLQVVANGIASPPVIVNIK